MRREAKNMARLGDRLDRFSCCYKMARNRYVHPFFKERMRRLHSVAIHIQENRSIASSEARTLHPCGIDHVAQHGCAGGNSFRRKTARLGSSASLKAALLFQPI